MVESVYSIKDEQERMYLAIVALAVRLSLSGQTMRTTEVLVFINSYFHFPYPYVSVRGVFQAAYRRAREDQKDAVATVFRSKWGAPLC